jgi:hypothetical protein
MISGEVARPNKVIGAVEDVSDVCKNIYVEK